MPSLHPRCVQHGLAVAPDGRCVLCRRQNPGGERASYKPPLSAAPTARESRRVRLWGGGALLVLIAAGTGLALRYTGSEPLTVQPTAAGARLTEPAYDPDAEQRALDKAKAADLAASLAMLERAEQERVQKQQLAAAQAEQQRQASLAARVEEERARDAARHEAITRELEEQTFRSLRGGVQVTMYSTDWCGVCGRARSYMRDKHIPFKEYDVERDAQARTRALALNPRGSVPTIAIDKELLIGFSPGALEERITRAAHARKR